MDKIRILNLKLLGRHGVYEFEKKINRIFELDIEIEFDLKKAKSSDSLSDTVDYGKVVNYIKKIFTHKDYNLIESLAAHICESLKKKFTLNKVIVRIRKPHAPIEASLDTVEVEVISGE